MIAPDALDPLERALLDHHRGDAGEILRLRFDTGEVQDVPVAWFFRGPAELDVVDRMAVDAARGRVLDVGAGAGAHALALQERGLAVTALEILPGAVRVLRERGVRDARREALEAHVPSVPYDTVLLLMNGTGLAGTLAGLAPLLGEARRVLAPGGVVLVDSTDPGDEDPGDGRRAGELQIQLEYRGRRGAPFPHLYAGPGTLAREAARAGLRTAVIGTGEGGRYLAACRAADSAA